MAAPVRVRFAPSPTGHLHVGGARTALFNWLYARHHRGTFILRIEDTDRSRSTDENIVAIVDALSWLGLDWDEGRRPPGYRQTERFAIYREHAQRAARGRARLLLRLPAGAPRSGARGGPEAERDVPLLRALPRPRARRRRAAPADPDRGRDGGQRPDPRAGDLRAHASSTTGSSFAPTARRPTTSASSSTTSRCGSRHVIRGDDHLSNTPKQILCYEALDYAVPEFAHVSLILGKDQSRLSKRHGATVGAGLPRRRASWPTRW